MRARHACDEVGEDAAPLAVDDRDDAAALAGVAVEDRPQPPLGVHGAQAVEVVLVVAAASSRRNRMRPMREVKDVRVTLEELKGRLGIDRGPEFFEFLVRRIGLKDVRIDGGAIVHPSFVPLEPLLREAVAALEREGARPEPCARCSKVFDVERDDGIFRDPSKLEGFLCRPCAESMTAWTYFQEWLRA